MHQRFTARLLHYAAQASSISTTFQARRLASTFFTTAHHALMVSGIAALCTLAMMLYRPDLAHQLRALTHRTDAPVAAAHADTRVMVEVASATTPMDMPRRRFQSATDAALQNETLSLSSLTASAQAKAPGNERQQQWVTNWISKRYRVANDATDMLVSTAYLTAKETKIDPLLILAVVAIESGFNPFAESAVGAQGLMQVMSKVHQEKFQSMGGVKAALNPVANMRVGSMILKDYVARGGSVEAGLKMYVGAAAFDNDAGYGSKVLAEYRRLKDVAMGKSVPVVFSAPVVVHNQPRTSDNALALPADNATPSQDKPIAPEAARETTPAERVAAM